MATIYLTVISRCSTYPLLLSLPTLLLRTVLPAPHHKSGIELELVMCCFSFHQFEEVNEESIYFAYLFPCRSVDRLVSYPRTQFIDLKSGEEYEHRQRQQRIHTIMLNTQNACPVLLTCSSWIYSTDPTLFTLHHAEEGEGEGREEKSGENWILSFLTSFFDCLNLNLIWSSPLLCSVCLFCSFSPNSPHMDNPHSHSYQLDYFEKNYLQWDKDRKCSIYSVLVS